MAHKKKTHYEHKVKGKTYKTPKPYEVGMTSGKKKKMPYKKKGMSHK